MQFLESASEGLTIATGDLNILNPALPNVLDFPTNNFRVRIDPNFGDALLVMDSTVQWNDDYGEDWFLNSMVGIGSMLGLELANDLPVTNLMARFTYDVSVSRTSPIPSRFSRQRGHLHGQYSIGRTATTSTCTASRSTCDAGREGLADGGIVCRTAAEFQPVGHGAVAVSRERRTARGS